VKALVFLSGIPYARSISAIRPVGNTSTGVSFLADTIGAIRASKWDKEDSGNSPGTSLTHPLTRMVLTSAVTGALNRRESRLCRSAVCACLRRGFRPALHRAPPTLLRERKPSRRRATKCMLRS